MRIALSLSAATALALATGTILALSHRHRVSRTFVLPGGAVNDVRVFEDKFVLQRQEENAGVGDSHWEVRSLEDGRLLHKIGSTLGWSPITGRALVSPKPRALDLVDSISGAAVAHLDGLEYEPKLAAVTYREDAVALVGSGDIVEVRSLPGGGLRRAFAVPEAHARYWWPTRLAFAADGGRLALESSWGKTDTHAAVSAWSVGTGQDLVGGKGWLLGFACDGEVVCTDHRTVSAGERLLHIGYFWHPTLSASGERLAVVSHENEGATSAFVVIPTDVPSLQARRAMRRIPSPHSPWKQLIGLSPNGKTLVVVRDEGVVEVYELSSGS